MFLKNKHAEVEIKDREHPLSRINKDIHNRLKMNFSSLFDIFKNNFKPYVKNSCS